jgi:hypothetical protein
MKLLECLVFVCCEHLYPDCIRLGQILENSLNIVIVLASVTANLTARGRGVTRYFNFSARFA